MQLRPKKQHTLGQPPSITRLAVGPVTFETLEKQSRSVPKDGI